MSFIDAQKAYNADLINNHSNLFNGDKGNGEFRGKPYPHVLQNGNNNLYDDIRTAAPKYFKDNKIRWHLAKANTTSSQVACVNHLFPIKDNKEAVEAIAKGLDKNFVDVIPICCDKTGNTYIAFEVVSKGDLLGEGTPTRGTNCTSIDALICAKDNTNKVWLITFEWKYTETHNYTDYSNEDRDGEPKGANGKGIERMGRYGSLIDNSQYLCQFVGAAKPRPNVVGGKYFGSVLYKGDFYQLMRQTLWAEQMIANKATEDIKADDFFHIHIIPNGNTSMLRNSSRTKGPNLESAWKGCLKAKGAERYKRLDPKDLFDPIVKDATLSEKYADLIDYLRIRYW